MKNLFDLTGKAALVTDASSGLEWSLPEFWQTRMQILLWLHSGKKN
jgi:hypothetical protein